MNFTGGQRMFLDTGEANPKRSSCSTSHRTRRVRCPPFASTAIRLRRSSDVLAANSAMSKRRGALASGYPPMLPSLLIAFLCAGATEPNMNRTEWQ